MSAHRRHNLTDKVWNLLEPHLPGREGRWGGVVKYNQWLNYDNWGNAPRRFIR